MRNNGHSNKAACHLLKGGWSCAKRDARGHRRCARYCCCVARLHGSLSDPRTAAPCATVWTPPLRGGPLDIPCRLPYELPEKDCGASAARFLPATVVSDHNRIRVASGGHGARAMVRRWQRPAVRWRVASPPEIFVFLFISSSKAGEMNTHEKRWELWSHFLSFIAMDHDAIHRPNETMQVKVELKSEEELKTTTKPSNQNTNYFLHNRSLGCKLKKRKQQPTSSRKKGSSGGTNKILGNLKTTSEREAPTLPPPPLQAMQEARRKGQVGFSQFSSINAWLSECHAPLPFAEVRALHPRRERD